MLSFSKKLLAGALAMSQVLTPLLAQAATYELHSAVPKLVVDGAATSGGSTGTGSSGSSGTGGAGTSGTGTSGSGTSGSGTSGAGGAGGSSTGGTGGTPAPVTPPVTTTPQAYLSVSTTQLYMGSVNLNATASQSVVVSNTGDADFTFSSAPNVAGSGYAATSNCGATLAAHGGSCVVTVTLTPTQTGSLTGGLYLSGNTGVSSNSPVVVTMHGDGVANLSASVSTSNLDFGSVYVGYSGALSVRLTNTGANTLSLSGAPVLTAGSAFAATSACGTSLAVGAYCDTVVTYTPVAPGALTGTLSVTTAAGVESVSLSAVGVAPVDYVADLAGYLTPQVASGKHPYWLGGVLGGQWFSTTSTGQDGAPSQTIGLGKVVTIAGGTPVTAVVQGLADNQMGHLVVNNSPVSFSNGGFSSVAKSATFQLYPGKNTISLEVTNVSGPGGWIAEVTDPSGATVISDATGWMMNTPVLTPVPANGSSLDFGTVGLGSSATQSFNITNAGGMAATGMYVTVQGSDLAVPATSCGTSASPVTLAAGATCSLSVRYTPTSASAWTGVSIQVYNPSLPATSSTALTGSGVAVTAVSAGSLTFAPDNFGDLTQTQSVVFSNTGATTVALSAPALSGASATEFAASTNCGTTLAAGASCVVNVAYHPNAQANASAVLTLGSQGGNQSVALSGTAASLTVAGTLMAGATSTLTVSSSVSGSLAHVAGLALYNSTVAVAQGSAVTLAPGASSVSATLTAPGTGGTYTLFLLDAAGVQLGAQSVQVQSLTGTLSAAAGSSTALGAVLVGTTQSETFEFRNTGTLGLTGVMASLSAQPYLTVTANTCGVAGTPVALAAGASCSVTVRYAPTAAESLAASLTIASNASNSPATLALTGTAVGDAYAGSTVLLDHFDSPNGSTAVVDSSPLGNVVASTVGTPGIQSAVTRLGSGALAYTTVWGGANTRANLQYSGANNQFDFGTGDFTVEVWAQNSSYGCYGIPLVAYGQTSGTQDWALNFSASGAPSFVVNNATGTPAISLGSSVTVPAGTWANVAVSRSNGLTYLYLNGVVVASTNAVYNASAMGLGKSLSVGSGPSSGTNGCGDTTGYLDELRVTNGVGRYTGTSYTVAATEFAPSINALTADVSASFGTIAVGQNATRSFTYSNTGSTAISGVSATVAGNSYLSMGANTCAGVLAGGSSCQVTVQYSPSAVNTLTGTLTVSAAGSPDLALALSGAAVVPTDSVNAGTLTFASTNMGLSSTAQSVTLSNTGAVPLQVSAITATGPFSVTQNCGTLPASLAGAGSCVASVVFTPVAIGAATGTLTFTTNGSNQTVTLAGVGLQALPQVSTASLAFGHVNVGDSTQVLAVQVSNTSSQAMTLTSLPVSGTNAAAFSATTNCGATLAASASCTVNVVFDPATAGAMAATFTVVTPQGNSTVALTGTGDALGVGGTLVGGASSGTLTLVTGANTSLVSPTSVALYSGATLSATSSSVAWNTGSKTLTATFGTLPAAGSYTASVLNASAQVLATAPVSLVSNTASLTAASGSSVNFGAVNLSSNVSETYTFANTGGLTLTGVSASLSGNSFASILTNTCTTSLAVGASCAITVKYAPTAIDTLAATLTVASSAANTPATLSLTGSAIGTTASLDVNFASGTNNLSNSAALSAVGSIASSTAAGYAYGFADASYYSGTSTTADLSVTASTDFTEEGWVYFKAAPSTYNVLLRGDNSGSIDSGFLATGFKYQVQPGTSTVQFNSITWPVAQWFHLAVVRRAGSASLYLNGVKQGASVADTTDAFSAANPLRIGSNSVAGYSLQGLLGSVRFTKQALYSANFTPTGSPAAVAPTLVAASGSSTTFGPLAVSTVQNMTYTYTVPLGIPEANVYAAVAGDSTLTLAANTCGTSAAKVALLSGATCSVTVAWTPTAAGTMAASTLTVTSTTPAASTALSLTGTASTTAADPYYANVVIQLLNTPVDTGPKATPLTVGSAVATVTSPVKSGPSSLQFANSSNAMISPVTTQSATMTGAFTVESWVYLTSSTVNHILWQSYNTGYGSGEQGFGIYASGGTQHPGAYGLAYVLKTQGYTSPGAFYTAVYPSLNAWHHVAVTRDANNVWRFFIDGVLTPYSTDNESWNGYTWAYPSTTTAIPTDMATGWSSSGGPGAGSDIQASGFQGSLQNFRVTNGVARYVGNFTSPVASLTTTTASPATLVMGAVTVGTPSTQSVTLTNHYTQALTSLAVSTSSSEFTQTNNCGSSLAAGASCTVNVTISAALVGARSGTVTLSSAPGVGSIIVPITATASAAGSDPLFSSVTLLSYMQDGTDASNGARNLTLTGSVGTSTAQKKFGASSMLFSGGYLHYGAAGVLPTSPAAAAVTVEAWVYPTTTSVIGLFDGGPSQTGIIRQYNTNQFAVQGLEGSGANFSLTANAWSHVAAVYDNVAKTITVYVNGTKVSTGSTGTSSWNAGGTAFNIGGINLGSNGAFAGYIDSMRVTQAARYTANFAVPTAAFPNH